MKSKICLPRDILECPFMNDESLSVMCICWDSKDLQEISNYQYVCYPTKYCVGNKFNDCNNCNRKCKVNHPRLKSVGMIREEHGQLVD